jgi:hypothetical protein
MEKCAALGIRPGPVIGMLKSGKSIKLDNGNIVKSEDVTEDPEEASTYLVIDCPSESYIPSLLKEPLLQSDKFQDLCGIFHVSPLEVVKSESYVNWVKSLPLDINHIMLNDLSYDFGTSKLLKENAKLNMIAPEVFLKMLPGEPSKVKDNTEADADFDYVSHYKEYSGKCIQAVTDMRLFCRPNKGDLFLLCLRTRKKTGLHIKFDIFLVYLPW